MKIDTVSAVFHKKEYERADNLFREHFTDSEDHLAWYLFGTLNIQRKAYGIAVEALKRCIALKPDFDVAYSNLIVAYKQLGRIEQAEATAREAIDRFHERWDYHRSKGKVVESAASMLVNLGSTYLELAEYAEAEKCYRKALQYDPKQADAHWNLGLAQLTQRNWEGWTGYEWGFQRGERQPRPYIDEYPQWTGQDIRDKTILVWGEQGLGDEILFSSCIPDLEKLGAKIIFDCHPRLDRVFERSFPNITISGTRKNHAPGLFDDFDIDYHSPLGSLPKLFRTDERQFRKPAWLKPDRKKVAEWRRELGKEKIVGLSWRGGSQKTSTSKRSMPFHRLWQAVGRYDCNFVSLQYGPDVYQEVEAITDKVKVLEWAVEDYSENFNLTCACDLVITVQTAAAHVCGSTGTPVWVMVPFSRAWRYTAGEENPWYQSMKQYHQPEMYDWGSVLQRVATDLGEWVKR